ncbi:SusC/RagA family TonB-linked outer membrane protein [Epilithonimonas mollis]|uniref:TonB-linked outer membrane protein, SusC/RagA family n=1 Tax=Epilithonimonas mollis TaxID=216903 RepID=A0A1M6U1N9_9FLAO|nr:TonB-dependent receptor [Epilithonimonas mollis]SHK63079.1 TonB-linked outer membrane protein, SusC/RagA family [Epilithonimonas mollis]
MNLKYSKCLGLAAVLYFTANYSAQQQVNDTTSKEKMIEEVVVIGYGTQKKSNVTGAIASIKASDIEDIPAGKPEQVLQGRAAGVSVVTNSGQPGSGATVRIRGLTSFGAGGNDPMWVVDGIIVDGISWLNQSDIESIEVLKDGASSAIYGVSAARGVVLVTTKKGKKGVLSLAYNGSFGTSQAARKLDLLNATQYATIINEGFANDNSPIRFTNPSMFGIGTDWQDTIFNTGDRQSHEVSINGGNDKSTYYASFGYFDQTGIVMGDISNYKRINARLNSTHKVLDILTIGQTFLYTHQKSQGIGVNETFGGPLSSAINLDPTTPAVVTDWSQVNPANYTNAYIIRDLNGNPYGISPWVNQEMSNPLAYRYTQQGRYGWSDDFVGNVFAELKLTEGLTFKTTLNGKKSYWGSQGFTPKFYLSPTLSNLVNNNLNRVTQTKFEWSMENTLTYQKRLGDHNFNIMLGQGVYRYNIGSGQSVTYSNIPVENWYEAAFYSVDAKSITASAWDTPQTRRASYFGRFIYDYQDKYLFTGTFRRDGSSKFLKYWGNFPSFSAGWNVHKEGFWKDNDIINTLKIRGGYGVLGNDAIEDFMYRSSLVSGSNYPNGEINPTIIIGYSPNTLGNPNLKWEETAQSDIGADIRFLNDFTLGFDYYYKKTKDILRRVAIPGYVGVPTDPFANIGDMENKGMEFELGYKKNWQDFGFSFNGNFSTNKNKVLRLEDDVEWREFAGLHSMGPVSRLQVGKPVGTFYGYTYSGVFQNQEQINSYTNGNGDLIIPNAKPGDFIWQDNNGDGKITQDDMVDIGSSLPKFTYGFTLNMNYKDFDLIVFAQGQGGNMLLQGLRRLDMLDANYQTAILNRWTGEGSTNDNPRLTRNDPNGNYTKMSKYYLQKGDYMRIKLVSLGYTIPKDVTTKFGANKVRIFVTGENLFTFTKYTGYDPEIAGGNEYGIDRAYYPQARTFLFGANIQF